MKFSATTNVDEFNLRFVEWMRYFGKSWPVALREEGKQIARFLATPPRGIQPATPPGTKLQGERAIQRDVARVFGVLTPRSIRMNFTNEHVRNRLLDVVAKKDYRALMEVWARIKGEPKLVSVFTQGAVERERDVRGRVRRKKARYITMDEDAVRAYITKKKGHVGMARGGWAEFLVEMGGSVPGWVSRHLRMGSSLDQADLKKDPSIKLQNFSPWARYRDEANRILDNAFRNRSGTLFRKVLADIEQAGRETLKK